MPTRRYLLELSFIQGSILMDSSNFCYQMIFKCQKFPTNVQYMLPNVIDPMMPSNGSSFCARCQILVQASVEKMRLLE